MLMVAKNFHQFGGNVGINTTSVSIAGMSSTRAYQQEMLLMVVLHLNWWCENW